MAKCYKCHIFKLLGALNGVDVTNVMVILVTMAQKSGVTLKSFFNNSLQKKQKNKDIYLVTNDSP
jgi:hypothetical protein